MSSRRAHSLICSRSESRAPRPSDRVSAAGLDQRSATARDGVAVAAVQFESVLAGVAGAGDEARASPAILPTWKR